MSKPSLQKRTLRQSTEFLAVRNRGTAVASAALKVAGLPAAERRLGIIVGRGVGGAVVRNRIKRVVREHFRLNCTHYPRAHCVVVARHPAAALANASVRNELDLLVARLIQRLGERNKTK